MSFNFNKESVLKQAENYLKNNQLSAAINEYKKIVETTQDLNIMNLLGDLYIRVGDDKKAIEYFSPVAENYSNNGFTVKAIAMYKKICKLDTNNIELTLKLADLYVNQKYLVEARQLYNQVLEVYKKTKSNQDIIKILKLINSIEPENIIKKLELANFYEKESLFNESQETYFEASRELLKQGKDQEAIKVLEEVFNKYPNSKMALINLVDGLVIAQEAEKAIGIVKKAARKDSGDLDLLIVLGKTYLRLNRLDEAEKTFVDLLIRDSNRYEYLIELAKVFLANKEFDRVVDLLDLFTDTILEKKQKRKLTTILKEVLKQNPNHLKTVKSLVYIYRKTQETSSLISTLKLLVKVAKSNGKEAEAINALRSLIELEPENSSYKETLENINVSNLNPNNKASTINPITDSIRQNVLAQLKQSKEAIASNHTQELIEGMIKENGSYMDAQMHLLEAMVSSNPDYLEARIKLKNVYLQKELKEKAAKECLEISKLYFETKKLEKAKEILEEASSYDPLIAKTEEFKLTFEKIKETVNSTNNSKEIELVVQNKKDTRSRIKRPTEPLLSSAIAGTSVSQKLSLDALDAFSKQQVKENLELNFSTPNFEVDLSSIFSKPEIEVTKSTPLVETNTQTLLAKDINWLAEANQPLDREWRRAIRSNQEMSLILIKIDNFAEYLISLGQTVVEKSLKELLKAIETEIHRGGDQLLVYERKDILFLILPETPADGALVVAQRIKESISKNTSDNLFTVSQIIATGRPKRSNKPGVLVKKIANNFSRLSSINQICMADD
ncbi:MAG: tetratricopeptide repeat protein [Acidobacteria bacterium]|nr:tetratricopeptide repeat protein [Acidobacteriota bacterium]